MFDRRILVRSYGRRRTLSTLRLEVHLHLHYPPKNGPSFVASYLIPPSHVSLKGVHREGVLSNTESSNMTAQLLVSELTTLLQDSRKKNPELRTVCSPLRQMCNFSDHGLFRPLRNPCPI